MWIHAVFWATAHISCLSTTVTGALGQRCRSRRCCEHGRGSRKEDEDDYVEDEDEYVDDQVARASNPGLSSSGDRNTCLIKFIFNVGLTSM